MSLLWSDGFDTYATVDDLMVPYTVGTFGAGVITNGGRFGGGCFDLGNYGAGLIRAVSGAGNSVFTGAAVSPEFGQNFNSTHAIFTIKGNGGAGADVTYDGSRGVFEAHVLSNSSEPTVIAKGTAFFQTNAYHFIEMAASISYDGTPGNYHQHATVEVWVDNVLVLSGNGSCSTGTPSDTIVGVSIGNTQQAGTNSPFLGRFDDWYIHSSTRYGDLRIETSLPISDASPNDGTPSTAGPHYAMVDADPVSLSHFITLNDVAGQEERFGMAHLTSTPIEVLAVQTSVYASSENGAVTIESTMVSGGVEADGDATILSGSPSYAINLQENDPNTSAPWTGTAVDDSLAGVKVTA